MSFYNRHIHHLYQHYSMSIHFDHLYVPFMIAFEIQISHFFETFQVYSSYQTSLVSQAPIHLIPNIHSLPSHPPIRQMTTSNSTNSRLPQLDGVGDDEESGDDDDDLSKLEMEALDDASASNGIYDDDEDEERSKPEVSSFIFLFFLLLFFFHLSIF